MTRQREVVITGLGVVSPIGIGRDDYWSSLRELRSGVKPISLFDASAAVADFGGEVTDFDPKEYIKPRKSLKVMSRDIQFGVTAAAMARVDAGLGEAGSNDSIDPERLGVVFGSDFIHCDLDEIASTFAQCGESGEFDFSRWGDAASREMFPLWMLKYLPNMPACHITIAHDARGHNNSITLGAVSSLLAVIESARVIERGHADVMIAGGVGCRLHPTLVTRSAASEISQRRDDPVAASRPFDRDRDGFVNGEGAAAFVLESREHAEARRARIFARFINGSSTFAPKRDRDGMANATARAIRQALSGADASAADISHVNAHGMSTQQDDIAEANAIRATLGDVPVTAPKSYFGYLGSGTGAVEMAASVLALQTGWIPATLNYEHADPACPINVLTGDGQQSQGELAVVLNQDPNGQSVAIVLGQA